MLSETVEMELWMDRQTVKCSFTMKNFGDSLTLPVGFPDMYFQHYYFTAYSETDLNHVDIFVDGKQLNRSSIQIPEELRPAYDNFIASEKADRILYQKLDSLNTVFGVIRDNRRTITGVERGSLADYLEKRAVFEQQRERLPFDKQDFKQVFQKMMANDAFPWYVWNVHFKKDETRVISVHYKLPSGVAYRDSYRYASYLLSTGAGWKDVIGNAKITARLHDIPLNKLRKMTPEGYAMDRKTKTITWDFEAFEPGKTHDIRIEYASGN